MSQLTKEPPESWLDVAFARRWLTTGWEESLPSISLFGIKWLSLYWLTEHCSWRFQENDNSAQLLVAKPLDFERRRTYSIDIIATDNMFGRGSAIRLNSKAVVCRATELAVFL